MARNKKTKLNTIEAFDAWHKTRVGYAVMSALELALAYIVGSRAIETGSLWQYALAIALLVGAINNALHVFKKANGQK